MNLLNRVLDSTKNVFLQIFIDFVIYVICLDMLIKTHLLNYVISIENMLEKMTKIF